MNNYTCTRIKQLEDTIAAEDTETKFELIRAFKQVGCDFCSGNYYDCKDYTPEYDGGRNDI